MALPISPYHFVDNSLSIENTLSHDGGDWAFTGDNSSLSIGDYTYSLDFGDNGGDSALPFSGDDSFSFEEYCTGTNILSHDGGDKTADRAPPLDPFSMEDDTCNNVLPHDGGDNGGDRALPIDPFSIEDTCDDDVLSHEGGDNGGDRARPIDPFSIKDTSDNILSHDDGDNSRDWALPLDGDNSLSVQDYTRNNVLRHDGGDNGGDRALPIDPFSIEDTCDDILSHDGGDNGGDRALPINPLSIEDNILPHDGGFPLDGVNSLPPEGFTGDMATDGGDISVNNIMSQDWRMSIPLGMKFRPTDEELVINYLELESFGVTSSSDGIINRVDVYAHQPHQLPNKAVDHGDGKHYFYTHVKKIGKSKSDRRIKSRPGCHWKATQTAKPIKGSRSGATHGFKMPLAYHEEGDKKTQWLMQEYKLKSHSSSSKEDELVLAVVYYHHRKRRREDEDN